MEIPYTVTARPDTGLWNSKIGIWLFLASEVMLFGGLFSAFVFLKLGAAADPAITWGGDLNTLLGFINTMILIASSVTVILAWTELKLRNFKRYQLYMGLTIACSLGFLVVKSIEYGTKFADGIYPSTSTFYAIYFTMTGLHALHVIGGAVVLAYFWLLSHKLYKRNPEHLANRVEVGGLFWHFVDLVWIFLFPLFYLLSTTSSIFGWDRAG